MTRNVANSLLTILTFIKCWELASAGPIRCRNIPERPEQVVAEICEAAELYTFNIAGEKFDFQKLQFRSRLDNAILAWWTENGGARSALSGATIEVWLSIPDSNPGNAQGRAVLNVRGSGRVVLGFDLRAEEWTLSNTAAAILASESYPDSFGWRPTELLVSPTPSQSPEKVSDYLASQGINLAASLGNGWYEARTSFLDEASALRRSLDNDKNSDYIRAMRLNKVMEWVALRGQGFEYTWGLSGVE